MNSLFDAFAANVHFPSSYQKFGSLCWAVMKYSCVGKLNATTCHHQQKFHSWTHQFLIGLAVYVLYFFYFFLPFSVVTCQPLEFRLDLVVLSVLNSLLTSFRCTVDVVRFSCPSSMWVSALDTRTLRTGQTATCKCKTHCRFPSPFVRSSVHPFVRYIWFNHVVFAKYRYERHRYSQFTLLPTKSVCPTPAFVSTQIIIIIVHSALFVRNEWRATTTSTKYV